MRKRLWLLVAVLAASLSSFAAVAAAAPLAITLSASPNPVVTGGEVTFSGTVTDAGAPVAGATVTLTQFEDAACTVPLADFAPVTTDASGNFSEVLVADVPPGDYFFQASTDSAVSACLTSTVIAAGPRPFVPEEANVFLCYSKFQTDPGVWGVKAAAKLIAEGYWQPWAIAGNVPGGTNVGGYHLVCNLAAGQAATGAYTDGAGGFEPPAYAGTLGIYPIAK
jgi:hypothetical protein